MAGSLIGSLKPPCSLHVIPSIHYLFAIASTFFFSPSHLLSSPFYSLSLLVVTQMRGHIAGSSHPLPTTGCALHYYREKISALSSLVDSCRIALTHARRSQQLILFCFANKLKSRHGRIRTHGLTLPWYSSSIRWLPLIHRGDMYYMCTCNRSTLNLSSPE